MQSVLGNITDVPVMHSSCGDHMVDVKTVEKPIYAPTATILGQVVSLLLDPGDKRQKKTLVRIDSVESDSSHYAKYGPFTPYYGRWIEEWYYGRYA